MLSMIIDYKKLVINTEFIVGKILILFNLRSSSSSWKNNWGKITFKDFEVSEKHKNWMNLVGRNLFFL